MCHNIVKTRNLELFSARKKVKNKLNQVIREGKEVHYRDKYKKSAMGDEKYGIK